MSQQQQFKYCYRQQMIKKKELQQIGGIDTVPTQYEKRPLTDIFCLILGLVFSAVMIILAASLFNYKKFYQANFPADSDGKLCGIDNKYDYVYFTNPPEITRRVCVDSCPKQGDEALKCVSTDTIGCRFTDAIGFEVKYYETKEQKTRSGYFCYPSNQELKNKILANSNLEDRELLYKSLDTIVLCFFVAFGFSILYLVLVQFFPKIMNNVAVILGSIIILACAICLFTYGASENLFRIIIGCILIFTLIVIVTTFIKNQSSLRIHGIFLTYSTHFIRDRPLTLLYIPLFLLFLIAFIIMIVLEFSSFWTTGDLSFSPNEGLFHKPVGVGPIVFSVFVGIQAVWGLVFLKMAFNFCVSGEAVLWYYNIKQSCCYPLKLLICKHFGSVVGGSFIIACFTFFDFVVDFFKPASDDKNQSCYASCFNKLCRSHSIFDMVRTDSMAYINLTGNPYCNSARYCQYLCDRSVILDNSQSSSRVYRLCAHFLLAGSMVIFAMYIKGVISSYALVIIIVNSIFVCTMFISLHADATEAISIIFLVEEELTRRQNKSTSDFHNRKDIESNLTGFKLHQEIVDEVKKERLQQFDKQNA